MRQQLAAWVAATCLALVAILALEVARRVNPDARLRELVTGVEPGLRPSVDRGRAVYEASGCALCHSIEGRGNPRNPLDGVGARRDPAALRAWIFAEGVVADSLPSSALRTKRAYASDLPAEDVDALIEYLAGLAGG